MNNDNFAKLGFGSAGIGFGKKLGIVVVDFQKGLTDPAFPMGNSPGLHKALENTAKLLAVARPAGIPVATCYTAYSSERDALQWKVPTVRQTFHHGTAAVELDPRIYDASYDTIFAKRAPSIFFETGVTSFFVKEGVDTVIVTGCATSGCIRASIIDAFSHGYRVIVPEPCVGDHDEQAHRDNLRDVGRRYCDIVSLETVLAHIAPALSQAS